MPVITFTVFGEPVGAGSKNSFVPIDRRTGQPFRKNGRIIVNTVDTADERGKPWSEAVKSAARAAMGDRPILVREPCALVVMFFMPRPKSHFGSGANAGKIRLRAMNEEHIKAPDATKLVRRLEDALTGIVWHDDSAVVHQRVGKFYAHHLYQWRPHAEVAVLWGADMDRLSFTEQWAETRGPWLRRSSNMECGWHLTPEELRDEIPD